MPRRPRPRLSVRALEDRLTPATAGSLDPTFGAGGFVTFPFADGSTTDSALAVALAPDGGVVAAGSGGGHHAVARLTADGRLDPAFGAGGRVVVPLADVFDKAAAVAVQPDGRVVAVGQAAAPGRGLDMTVLRLTPAGQLDPTFGAGGKLTIAFPGADTPFGPGPSDDAATAVQVMPDGRVVLAGLVTTPDAQDPGRSLARFAVVRLNPDGSFDPSFGDGGKAVIDFTPAVGKAVTEGGVADVRVLADGRVVVGGYVGDAPPAGSPGRWREQAVARLTADGQLDPTFGGGGLKAFGTGPAVAFEDETVTGLDVQPDGRVVVLSRRRPDGVLSLLAPVVVRLTADGQFDPSFDGDGVWSQGSARGDVSMAEIAAAPDGKVVLAGTLFDAEPAFVRLNPDGSPDATFGTDGFMADTLGDPLTMPPSGAVRAAAVQPDGRVVFAGTATDDVGQQLALVGRVLGVSPPNTPPTISDIPDKTLTAGTAAAVQADFTVGDADTPAEELTVAASSSNPDLVPPEGVFVGGFGATRTVFVTPRFGATGSAVVTVTVTDAGGLTASDAFTVTVNPPPVTIPAGPRIPAGEFNWLQATPDGTLAELVWAGDALVYRTRAGGGWAEEGIVNAQVFAGGVISDAGPTERYAHAAQLLFAPDGTPHAFLAGAELTDTTNGAQRQYIDHYARTGGKWARAERITVSDSSIGGENVYHLTGTVGPGGVFDLVADQLFTASGGDRLLFVTNKGGGWSVETITTTSASVALGGGAVGDRWAPRFLSAAADSDGFVHVTFTPDFYGENFGKVFSQLGYATNRGGAWRTETVYSPPDGTGDAGLGASVAVGPGNQVAVASFFVDRVGTGSPASAQLLYHTRGADGRWATRVVADHADGYAAGDGSQYTGFSPLLQFDGGTPVITFADMGAQHLPRTSANETAGQVRTATLTPGGWALATVFPQADPLHNQLWYPVRTVLNGQPVFGGLRVADHTDAQGELTGPPDLELIEVNAPAIAPRGPAPGTPGGPPGAGAVGAGAGGGPVVQVYDRDGALRFQAMVFDPAFTGGVRAATADFNRDGIPDVVVGTGPGGPTRVRVLDGKDQHELFAVDPFEAAFTGGVYVAAGDLTGDGVPELVITPDEGGGPRVRVLDGANSFAVLADFFGIDDPNFRGGARAAVGDVNADTVGDLVVAAGFQGGPRVAGFDGTSLASGRPAHLFGDFFAFEQTLRNGVFVAVGDLDGDGFAELIAGGGPGGGPRVTAFSGKSLLSNQYDVAANFFAGDPGNRGGVRLAARDLDGDDRADLVTGAGAGAGSRVTAYYGKDLSGGTPPAARDFDAFPGFTGGVFVG